MTDLLKSTPGGRDLDGRPPGAADLGGSDPAGRHPDGVDLDGPQSRRSVLLLLGAGALAPVVIALTGRSGPVRTQVGDLAVGVLGSSRRALAGDGANHPHTDADAVEVRSWPDVVRVHLEVRNLGGAAMLLSPGQFRLRLRGGLSVMPSAWLHEPAALGAGQTRTTWVDYRAPADRSDLELEFTPAGGSVPVTHALPYAARERR